MITRSYLDHAASSPLRGEVLDAMSDALSTAGNPSSLHTSGRGARRLLEEGRESLAISLGADPAEVVFTSGGTEANNLAVLGGTAPGAAVAISAIEHPSVTGVRGRRDDVRVLPVTSSGHLDVAAARELLDGQVGLVSVQWVNNETGAVQPVADVVELGHAIGARVHSDAVQALGHVAVDFTASSLDLLTVSAHKVGGPVGVGALVVRRGTEVQPSGFGGGQEARLRSGTVPVALAVGFAAAARLAVAELAAEAGRLAALRDRLIAGAAAAGAVPNTVAPCGPAIVNLTFPGVRADDLLLLLDGVGIDASTGSACTAGVHQPSEVLLAMGRTLADAGASLRFSLGPNTTGVDIERVLAVLPDAVARARAAAA
jgi:cysteine desulfurase